MQNEKLPVLTGLIVEESITLTLNELSCACSVHAERILDLVEEGILDPVDRNLGRWRFSGASLNRARTALRLQQDLGINLAGAALVLDMMDELECLRAQLRQRGTGS
jgi:chaperone modulatory protein CbpM